MIGTEGVDQREVWWGVVTGMERVGVDRVVAVLCRVRRGSGVVVRWFMTSMVLVAWVRGSI